MNYAPLVCVLLLLAGCGHSSTPEVTKAPAAAKPVQILQFYTSTNPIARGDQTLICYGVENAQSVRLEPAIEEIAPSLVRCIPYSPKASSELKLVATGTDGSEATKAIQITVAGVAASPKGKKSGLILSFVSSAKSVTPGQEVTFCYQTQNATSVKMQPDSSDRTLPVKGCVTEHVNQKTQFTLTASSADGKQDHESVTVLVAQ